MAVDVLICPDCGGVIGGKGIDAEGRGPCTCFNDDAHSSHTSLSASEMSGDEADDPSDTVSIPAPAPAGRDANDFREKLCVVCGKNVAGHRRIKDSRGYLCLPCAKAEIAEEKAGTIPCAECGRRVKEGGLVAYDGIKICRKCHEDHKELKRKAVKKVATHHYEAHEKKGLMIILAIFVILGLIVLWRQFLS